MVGGVILSPFSLRMVDQAFLLFWDMLVFSMSSCQVLCLSFPSRSMTASPSSWVESENGSFSNSVSYCSSSCVTPLWGQLCIFPSIRRGCGRKQSSSQHGQTWHSCQVKVQHPEVHFPLPPNNGPIWPSWCRNFILAGLIEIEIRQCCDFGSDFSTAFLLRCVSCWLVKHRSGLQFSFLYGENIFTSY